MFGYKLLTLIGVLLFISCLPDKPSITESQPDQTSPKAIEAETNRTSGDTPEIGKVEVDVKIPRREDWVFIDSFSVPDFKPSGIGYWDPYVFLTDSSQNQVIAVELFTHRIKPIADDMKVTYIDQRGSRVLLPDYEKDSLYVYRGEPTMYNYKLEEHIEESTAADGLRIDNIAVVDGKKNRIIRSYLGESSIIGEPGSGPGQFSDLNSIHMVNDMIYVADSGNSRIQVFSMEGEFQFSFGPEDGLIEPTGLTSGLDIIYVSDRQTKYIYLYNFKGELIYKMNSFATAPIDINFVFGKLFVADTEGGTYKVYGNKVY